MSEPRDVTVSIFGNRYTLRSESDADRLGELAAEVDARMREAANAGGAAGADRIAVLAALNLADELVRERDARRQERENLESRAGKILASLNDEVGKTGAQGVS
jgi:cell division protein ZapA